MYGGNGNPLAGGPGVSNHEDRRTMPHNPHFPEHDLRHVAAYNRMMERVREVVEQSGDATSPIIRRAVAAARNQAVEAGELTAGEADEVANFLLRDLQDAGGYLADTGLSFTDWLRIDLHAIEDRILDAFRLAADQTRLELMQLEERARHAAEYRTGEIAGIGTLQCSNCGQLVSFHDTKHIPPCPKCHGTLYVRPRDEPASGPPA